MKRKQRVRLSIEDLQVKSFSATLNRNQVKDVVGGSNGCNYDTSGACPATVLGCNTSGNDSGTGASQTACIELCGPGTTNG